MSLLNKKGLNLTPKAGLKASRSLDGRWIAWIEQDGLPLTEESGRTRTFEGSSCYQAQCRAYQWYFPETSFAQQFHQLISS